MSLPPSSGLHHRLSLVALCSPASLIPAFFTFGLNAGTKGALKALVGSFCVPNMGLALSLSLCFGVLLWLLQHFSVAVEEGTHTPDIR